MILKLKSGGYRIYSHKKDPTTNKRRNPGTFYTMAAAKKHGQEIQYFRHKKIGQFLSQSFHFILLVNLWFTNRLPSLHDIYGGNVRFFTTAVFYPMAL
ncbi:MAG: hypothetical protein IPI88_08535 [Chitinophagaceae bacterium]|nr:hypothetical protein [Chitinophagaceae bacterium]